ncbi:recombinase family protein [Haloarchaeobius sp. HME9146]|uniref:recombinase family protein n=1 Tax=Haloarchaeobius sp. HME9146 TaxID=2978732 RepID=UPI0021BFA44E|nr:recombinase family protein [Haloarchaeobius sp. HME9146]MCT9096969.1 recombinase family protein [Haloarchaeobius sp. HME9146]
MSNPRAIGYTRLSQTSDTSIPDQKQEIRDLAAREGFSLVKIYNDGERSSGFDATRPEYLEMQAYLESNDVDVLLVRDRDRLSRDKRERSILYYDLDEWGVELWTTVDGQVELSDDESWLIEMIRNYMDDVAKRREIQKAKQKVRERVESGYWQGRPPFGFQFDTDKKYLEPDSEKFQIALTVIGLWEDGATWSEIGDETGVSNGTISRILNNKERYLTYSE